MSLGWLYLMDPCLFLKSYGFTYVANRSNISCSIGSFCFYSRKYSYNYKGKKWVFCSEEAKIIRVVIVKSSMLILTYATILVVGNT